MVGRTPFAIWPFCSYDYSHRARPGDPRVVIPGLCAAASGVATFVTALIGLFKQKDRTFLVVFCAVIGFFVSLMVIFEVIEGSSTG